MRFEKNTAEDNFPTDFDTVSCPANIIVLRRVSAGRSRRRLEIVFTGLGK